MFITGTTRYRLQHKASTVKLRGGFPFITFQDASSQDTPLCGSK